MNALEIEATRVVDDLIAAGAAPVYRAENDSCMASLTYELNPNGDRQRCRRIIAEAKWRPALWAAVLQEIARRTEGDHG